MPTLDANLRMSDFYGSSLPGTAGQAAPPSTQDASGKVGFTDKNPAIFWVSLVAMLAVVRVLWEYSPQGKD